LSQFEQGKETVEASSLPSSVYTSSDIYDRELEQIFYSNWLLICHSSQLRNVGDIKVQRIGSKSIIVTRNNQNEISAFYNVCRHKGTKLVENSGNYGVIQCPYHGWTYKLDGKLVGCPDMNETRNFSKADFPLYRVSVEMWGGFVFVNLATKCEPLSLYLGDFVSRFNKYHLEDLNWAGTIGVYEAQCNWKVWMENFNECYHCPLVHPQTFGRYYRQNCPYDPKKIFGPYSMYYFDERKVSDDVKAIGTASEYVSNRNVNTQLTEDDLHTVYLPTLFPNTSIIISPSYVTVFHTWPEGVKKTIVALEMFAPPYVPTAHLANLMKDFHEINLEDIAIVRVAQEGLDSQIFQGGRFGALEGSVHQFQKLYWHRMNTGLRE
jgi:Rieske 2Fe-2S family protein